MKRKVTLNIDRDVIKNAKAKGFNVSKMCENYLKFAIQNFPDLDPTTLMRSPGFEPGSSAWESDFRTWIIRQNYRGANGENLGPWGNQLFTYGVRYAECLFKRDLGKVEALPVTNQANPLKGLAALSKALHLYTEFQRLVENSSVRWSGRPKNLVFADRLKRLRDPEEFWGWAKTVKRERPELDRFVDLVAVSGLRPGEAVASYNILAGGDLELELRGVGEEVERVKGYYNSGVGWLEHFWFPDTFLRNTKNAFVSFAPFELVEDISKAEALAGLSAVGKLLHKRGLAVRFKDFRKAWASMMQGEGKLTPSEVDLLQGRVTTDVFMANYFTPGFADKLHDRAFKGIVEIQEKIKT